MRKLISNEDLWITIGGLLVLGVIVAFIRMSYLNYVEEKSRDFDNMIVECGPYDDSDACDHSEPLDASDVYGPGEAPVNGSPGYHSVDGYYRQDGTHVDSYIRSNPDGNPNNNLGGK